MFIKANRANNIKSCRAKLLRGYDRGLSPLLRYECGRKLMVDVKRELGGFRVTQIDPQSPLTRLTAPGNVALTGSLEVGDRIVAMNGVPAPHLGSIQSAIETNRDRCEISVFDQRTHQTVSWNLHFEFHSQPVKRPQQEVGRQGKVFAIIAKPTVTPTLESAMSVSTNRIFETLSDEIRSDRRELIRLDGIHATAETILRTIDRLPINSADSVLMYIVGEDAYDPRFAACDPSHGQFFRIPTGDLLRRTIWDHLDSSPARLCALISDTSHASSLFPDDGLSSLSDMSTTTRAGSWSKSDDPSNLEWLFLGHRGRIDINASPRNRLAIFSQQLGGWFTHCFFESTERQSDWNFLQSDMRSTLEAHFAKQRSSLLTDQPSLLHSDAIALLKMQDSGAPEIRLTVARDKSLEALQPK